MNSLGGSVCLFYCSCSPFVTGFWKISLNVTFYYSNIYHQNEEWELPINLKVVTMCSSHLELPENNWKYFEKFCNSMYFNVKLRLIFQNRITFIDGLQAPWGPLIIKPKKMSVQLCSPVDVYTLIYMLPCCLWWHINFCCCVYVVLLFHKQTFLASLHASFSTTMCWCIHMLLFFSDASVSVN